MTLERGPDFAANFSALKTFLFFYLLSSSGTIPVTEKMYPNFFFLVPQKKIVHFSISISLRRVRDATKVT